MPGTSSNGKKAKRASVEEPIAVEVGSGNVFVDIGVPNPDLALAKAKLVQQILDAIRDRKLTQAKAAELLGLDQPKVSALVRGRVEGYSIDRLFKFLNLLGRQIEITVRPVGKGVATADTRVVVG